MRWPWRGRRRAQVRIGRVQGFEPNLPSGAMPSGIELTDTDTGKVYPMVPVFQGEQEGITHWAAVLHPEVEGDVILPHGHFELDIAGRPECSAVVVAFQAYARVVRRDEVEAGD